MRLLYSPRPPRRRSGVRLLSRSPMPPRLAGTSPARRRRRRHSSTMSSGGSSSGGRMSSGRRRRRRPPRQRRRPATASPSGTNGTSARRWGRCARGCAYALVSSLAAPSPPLPLSPLPPFFAGAVGRTEATAAATPRAVRRIAHVRCVVAPWRLLDSRRAVPFAFRNRQTRHHRHSRQQLYHSWPQGHARRQQYARRTRGYARPPLITQARGAGVMEAGGGLDFCGQAERVSPLPDERGSARLPHGLTREFVQRLVGFARLAAARADSVGR